MLATRMELLEKLPLGEDGIFELQAVRLAAGALCEPTPEALADDMAAFANSAGGVLLLGVNDRREVVGIPRDQLDSVEAAVRRAGLQFVKPPLKPVIERMTLPDSALTEQPVLRVEVLPGLFVHASPGGFLHRVGSARVPMAPNQLERLFQQRGQFGLRRFDETPVVEAPMQALEESLWRRFVSNRMPDSAEVQLRRLALVAPDQNGVLHPTVSGLLMASRVPHDFLKGSYVQAVAYRGTQVAAYGDRRPYQLDAQDLTGPLDEQILQTCDFIRRNMKVAAVKHPDGGREDLPQYDLLAVFEAVVNAVAHRDYAMPGARVRVRMFDDRLEIYSPGMLTNTMTTDSLPYRQASRNEVLTSLLARCPVNRADLTERTHLMDRRGEGVSLILSRSEALSGRRPVYEMFDSSELRLTIYAR